MECYLARKTSISTEHMEKSKKYRKTPSTSEKAQLEGQVGKEEKAEEKLLGDGTGLSALWW